MKRSTITIALTSGLLAAAASVGALAANGPQAMQGGQPQIQDSSHPYGESARAILFRGRERATSLFKHRHQASSAVQEQVSYEYETTVPSTNGGSAGSGRGR